MRFICLFFFLLIVIIFVGCSGDTNNSVIDTGLADTGQPFNPNKWYGKSRLELGKLMPEITNIDQGISGGPFVLNGQMGAQEISFTFENSERDARLMNVHVLFNEPITISEAQEKFGVNLTNIKPMKTRKYWHFHVDKPMIHGFMVDLKATDTDSSKLFRAWISYRLN